MSARGLERALARLAEPEAILAPARAGGGFGVYRKGDLRCRPCARVDAAQVQALSAEGVLAPLPERNAFVLTPAGRARVRRQDAEPTEAFLAQHRAIGSRAVIDADGDVVRVRGYDAGAPLRRLAALRDSDGRPWLAPEEIAAAERLRQDWDRGQAGLVRGSDWTSAPKSNAARSSNAQEAVLAARCDASRRVADALAQLAPPLRRVVEHVCLQEEGLDALERSEKWPARSGKIALKLGLAQLASMRV